MNGPLAVIARPPTVRPESQPFWDGARRGVLTIERCPACEATIFPPAGWCVACRSADVEYVEYAGVGRLVTYTINRVAWQPGMVVPFALGFVEFEDLPHVRIPCRLRIPFEQLAVGMPVRIGFEPGPDGFAVPSFTAAQAQ